MRFVLNYISFFTFFFKPVDIFVIKMCVLLCPFHVFFQTRIYNNYICPWHLFTKIKTWVYASLLSTTWYHAHYQLQRHQSHCSMLMTGLLCSGQGHQFPLTVNSSPHHCQAPQFSAVGWLLVDHLHNDSEIASFYPKTCGCAMQNLSAYIAESQLVTPLSGISQTTVGSFFI